MVFQEINRVFKCRGGNINREGSAVDFQLHVRLHHEGGITVFGKQFETDIVFAVFVDDECSVSCEGYASAVEPAPDCNESDVVFTDQFDGKAVAHQIDIKRLQVTVGKRQHVGFAVVDSSGDIGFHGNRIIFRIGPGFAHLKITAYPAAFLRKNNTDILLGNTAVGMLSVEIRIEIRQNREAVITEFIITFAVAS